MSNPKKFFISYAHVDEKYKVALKNHFAPKINYGNVDKVWYDSEIKPGSPWNEEIREHLNEANVIIMLLSADFLSSDYIQEVEFSIALKRHNNGEALVIGVVVRECDWENTPLKDFQLLSTDMAISRRKGKRDIVYTKIVNDIMLAAENFVPKPPKSENKKESEEDYSPKNGTDVFKIPLPYEKMENVDMSFYLKALPHFAEHLYIFTNRSIKLIDEYRKGYEKHSKIASSIDNANKLQNFLQILCREVNSVFFTRGGVRTHFRFLHIDENKYLRLAMAFSDLIDEEYALKPMPYEDDKVCMIDKAAELKVPLIYSQNPEWHSGPDPALRSDFKDYITFVLMDNSFMHQGKYLLSMGISFEKPELHRNLYFILNLSRFDDIVAIIVKSFAEALNIDVVDTILKNKDVIGKDHKHK